MVQKFFDGLKKKFQAMSKQQKYLGLAALVMLVVLLALIFAGPKPFSILSFGNQAIQITNVYSDRFKTPTTQKDNPDLDQTEEGSSSTTIPMGNIDEGEKSTKTHTTDQKTPQVPETMIAPNPTSGSQQATNTRQAGVNPTATPRGQQNPTATPRGSNPYPVQPTNTRITPSQTPRGTASPTPRITATKLPSQTPRVTSTPTQRSNQTPSFTPTNQPTATVSLPTETYDGPEAIWLGEWNVQFELDNGTFQTGKISFELTGNDGQYQANGNLGGLAFSIEGRIVYGGFVAFGSWSTSAGSGQIEITSTDGLVFGGNHESELAFCGARQGQNFPTECFVPPSQ